MPHPPIGIGSLKEIDDVDTRRELYYLVTRLTVFERIQFLRWCCSRANDQILLKSEPPHIVVTIEHTTGDAWEVACDLFCIHAQWGLPLQTILAGLERKVASKPRLS